MRLVLDRVEAGARSIVQLVSGSISMGYLGLTPFAIAQRYGLELRQIALSNRIGKSHGVVLASNAKQPFLVGVPFRSTAHQIACQWLSSDSESAQLIDLPPQDALIAYEAGILDGVSLWEPYLSLLGRTGTRVFTGQDLHAPLWNILVAAEDEGDGEHAALTDIVVEAHRSGVSRLRSGDIAGEELDYLGAVLGLDLPRPALRSLLVDDHEWPEDDSAGGASVLGATESINAFADHLGIPDAAPRDVSLRRSRRGGFRLGYSPSIMCAPLHLAVLSGSFDTAGVLLEFGPEVTIERAARLKPSDRNDVVRLVRNVVDDPADVSVITGQRVEQRLREVWRTLKLREEPRSAQAMLQVLFEHDLIPRSTFTAASFILTLRIAVQHESGRQASNIDAQFAIAKLCEFLLWSQSILEAPSVICERCRSKVGAGSVFCSNCGLNLGGSCSGCGVQLTDGVKFCPSCGASRDKK